MGSDRPRAFLSYTNVEPDASVAAQAHECLEHAGFDVWDFRAGDGIGEDWLDSYEDEICRTHAFVAVVSNAYLGKPQCRNEVATAHAERIERGILVAPLVIEAIDGDALGKGASQAFRRLMRRDGRDDRRSPTISEFSRTAEKLADKVVSTGLWSPQPATAVEDKAQGVALPLLEQTDPAHSQIVLVLDEAARDAAVVRAWLNQHGIRGLGRNRWAIEAARYEREVKPSLEAIVSSE